MFWKVLAGDIDPAIRTHNAFFSVWKKYGFTPEGFNLATLTVQVIKYLPLFRTHVYPCALYEDPTSVQ